MIQALIFDVDGTLADTEALHLEAFQTAFQELELGWHWDTAQYTRLLKVAGGKERLRAYWAERYPWSRDKSFKEQIIEQIHARKNQHYARLLRQYQLPLRPGIKRLIKEAQVSGLLLAIATTTSTANLEALMGAHFGPHWRDLFAAVFDGSMVGQKKPDPEVYWAVLEALGLDAKRCIAFEDSRIGLEAATAAGIATIVTPTDFTYGQNFEGALLVLPHLGDPQQPWSQLIAGADKRWVDLAALHRWQQGLLVEES